MKIKQAGYLLAREVHVFVKTVSLFSALPMPLQPPNGQQRALPASGLQLEEAVRGAGLTAGGRRRVELPTQQCSLWEEKAGSAFPRRLFQ